MFAQLRFNKVSELIHNSASHRDLDYAKVSVCFQEIIDKVRVVHLPSPACMRPESGLSAERAWASGQAHRGVLYQARTRASSPVVHGSFSQPGAHRGPPRGAMCTQEGGDFDVIPNSQFVVARTAQRNNESNYYVNNRKVAAKDVVELLKAKGIDLDNNRFLILQARAMAACMADEHWP